MKGMDRFESIKLRIPTYISVKYICVYIIHTHTHSCSGKTEWLTSINQVLY